MAQSHACTASGSFRKRPAQPHLTVFRMARLDSSSGDDLCLVRDIAATGAVVETLLPLRDGDRACIDLQSDAHHRGTATRLAGGRVAISFDQQVGVDCLLHREPDSTDWQHPRAPRFLRAASARLITTGHGSRKAMTRNVSLAGVALALDTACILDDGDRVSVFVEGMGTMPSTLRWHWNTSVGVQFDVPLALRPFQEWRRDHALVHPS
ncbi:MAG: hypothetical protein WCY11_03160 [Novosphingobium sp.]